MSTGDRNREIDVSFYQNLASASRTGRSERTTTREGSQFLTKSSFVRVAITAGATEMKATFDPIAAQEARETREVNLAIRLGYVPAKSSTR
jgi:hypothetical protein